MLSPFLVMDAPTCLPNRSPPAPLPPQVYEKGSLYDPKVLDITDEDLSSAVGTAVAQIAALSLAAHYPTEVAVPHLLVEGYKNVLALAISTDNPFPQAQKVGLPFYLLFSGGDEVQCGC